MLLNEVNSTVKSLVGEIQMLKDELRINKEKLNQVTNENNQLKQPVNLNHCKIDSLEQYDRRENLRIYNVPEITAKKDDSLEVPLNVAHELKIDLDEKEIQRVHRLGTKKISAPKPRPIIARFISYKKRKKLMYKKSL